MDVIKFFGGFEINSNKYANPHIVFEEKSEQVQEPVQESKQEPVQVQVKKRFKRILKK
jgi:hypothetical protein